LKPPRSRRKLSPEARAELGKPRTCTQCDETKEVSLKLWSLSKKGTRSWADICRVCQGVNSGQKPAIAKGALRPVKVAGHDDDTTLIEEMYFLDLSPQGDVERKDEIVQYLSHKIMTLPERESLRLFVNVVKPLVAGWMEPGAIHDDIIDGLLSTHRRRLVIATRYSAKSTLTSIYVAWRIFREPLIKIMVVSRGSKLAARMLRTVRRVFIENCPVLRHLVPTEDCLDNAEQFQVPASLKVTTGGATLTSLGITSNLPGFRADLTIGDDVEGTKDDSPEKVQDLIEVLNELHMINPKGEKVMLGTFQSEFSAYAVLGDLEERDGTKVWETHRACMFEEDTIDGEVILRSRWPGMFSDADAMDWRVSVTERAWRLHAMLIADPAILNERPLKIRDLILFEWAAEEFMFPIEIQQGAVPKPSVNTWGAPKGDVWYPARAVGTETAPYVGTCVAVDPASGLATRDAIGVAVLSITASGQGVIRHLEGVRGPDKMKNIQRVAKIVQHYGATRLVVEELADGLFGETLEGALVTLQYPMMVEKVTTGGQQKGRRIIESLAPPMAAGRLVMLEQVARSDHGGDFVNQLVRISYDGRTGKAKDHDDIVDALAHAVKAEKSSLISSIADNIGEHYAAKIDRWRGISLRYGGLGGGPEDGKTQRFESADVEGRFGESLTMAERLHEEDQVLVKLQARREGLLHTIQTDRLMGRESEPRLTKAVTQLDKMIRELKEHQVL
jgi:hypothetical protein